VAAKYRKVDPRIWRDEKFRQLDPEEKFIALYCLTSGQSNRVGIFPFSLALGAEETGTLPPTFLKRFGNVCHTLFWEWDSVSGVLYFPNWWKYNRPDNPNAFQSCLDDLHDVPQTEFLQRFYDNVRHLPETFVERMVSFKVNVGGNVTPRVPPPGTVTGTVTGTEPQKNGTFRSDLPCHNPDLEPIARRVLRSYEEVSPVHGRGRVATELVIGLLKIDGVTEHVLMKAVSAYSVHCERNKTAPQMRLGAKTFFEPAGEWDRFKNGPIESPRLPDDLEQAEGRVRAERLKMEAERVKQ